jgi:hypothetical protein
MAYKYIVKTWVWNSGNLEQRTQEFGDEPSAISYAMSANPAETVKVYVNEELVHSAQIPADTYA